MSCISNILPSVLLRPGQTLATFQRKNAKMLQDVATCVERVGQTHATFSSFSTQHVNVHVPQAPGAQEMDLTRMP